MIDYDKLPLENEMEGVYIMAGTKVVKGTGIAFDLSALAVVGGLMGALIYPTINDQNTNKPVTATANGKTYPHRMISHGRQEDLRTSVTFDNTGTFSGAVGDLYMEFKKTNDGYRHVSRLLAEDTARTAVYSFHGLGSTTPNVLPNPLSGEHETRAAELHGQACKAVSDRKLQGYNKLNCG